MDKNRAVFLPCRAVPQIYVLVESANEKRGGGYCLLHTYIRLLVGELALVV